MTNFNGKTYDEIKQSVKLWLETPHMIALPGGTWCHFCNEELCRNPNEHSRPQMLKIVISKLINDLEELRQERFITSEYFIPDETMEKYHSEISLGRRKQNNGEILWGVFACGLVYDKRENEFVYEGLPSSRTEEDLKNTRFTLAEAKAIATKFYDRAKKIEATKNE